MVDPCPTPILIYCSLDKNRIQLSTVPLMPKLYSLFFINSWLTISNADVKSNNNGWWCNINMWQWNTLSSNTLSVALKLLSLKHLEIKYYFSRVFNMCSIFSLNFTPNGLFIFLKQLKNRTTYSEMSIFPLEYLWEIRKHPLCYVALYENWKSLKDATTMSLHKREIPHLQKIIELSRISYLYIKWPSQC